MHHPDIYNIIAIIEDYFLLCDSEFRCQVESLICVKQFGELSECNQPRKCKGIKIVRQIANGRIEVNIFGYQEDNDSMDFQYFSSDTHKPSKVIEFMTEYCNSGQFSASKIEDAVREIMILDRSSATVKVEAASL
jgi:hypothetical protein